MRNARLKPDAKKPPNGPMSDANSENTSRWMQNGLNVSVTPVGSALRSSRVCTASPNIKSNQISSIPVQNYEYRTDECICKSTSTQELELGSRNQSKSCGRVNDELRTCTCTSAGGGEGSGAHESVGQRDVVVGGLEGRIELTLGQSSVRRRVVLNRTREVLEAAQVHADLSTQKKRVALISAILSKNVKSDDSRLFMCSARAVGGF